MIGGIENECSILGFKLIQYLAVLSSSVQTTVDPRKRTFISMEFRSGRVEDSDYVARIQLSPHLLSLHHLLTISARGTTNFTFRASSSWGLWVYRVLASSVHLKTNVAFVGSDCSPNLGSVERDDFSTVNEHASFGTGV